MPPNGGTAAAHGVTADLLACGFAQLPVLLTRSERSELESLPMDRWTLRPGPGASNLPDRKDPAHRFESLTHRLLGLVMLAAHELEELGALPRDVVSGGAWHSSGCAYAAAPAVRLRPHEGLELLTAIVAIGDGLEIAGAAVSCDMAAAVWVPAPAHDGATLTLLAGTLAQNWNRGAIPACRHRVGGGPARRSFLLFFVGDEQRSHRHGSRQSRCGGATRILRNHHSQQRTTAAVQVADRDAPPLPS
jgi:hypothetical protein